MSQLRVSVMTSLDAISTGRARGFRASAGSAPSNSECAWRRGCASPLYDADALEDGSPAWLLADAAVVTLPGGALAAEADPESFRWGATRY